MLQFGFSQFCTVIMLMLMMPSFADSMKIKVIYDGEDYPVEMGEKDTVATLKAKIEKIEEIGKIPIQKQILTKKSSTERVNGVLADQKTMDEYGIGEGDTIYMEVVTDTYFFRIDVNYGSIKNIVWGKCTDTVKDLKKKIANFDKLGKIPIQKQVLFNENTASVLEDNKTMDEYGIGEGDTIYMEVVTDTYFFRIDVNYGSIKNIVWGKCTDTVKDLKKKIANFDKLGKIPIQKQVLFNENTESVLEDNKTMDEYGIGEGDTIYMEVVSDIFSFPIQVNYGSINNIVWVKFTDTVKDLKKKIANFDKLQNIPIQKQVLTKEITWKFGIELADDEEIDKYAIGEGKNVFVSWDEFEFFVEYKEKMYPIKVNAMTTLKEVKEKMAEITGIPTEKQTLSHYKKGQCNDKARLIHFVKEDTTFLIMSDGSGITVEWQNHFWEFFVINVNGTDTVSTVTQKIKAISEQRHKSELNGAIILSKCDFDCKYVKALEDKKTMDEYGIGEGNTIHMKVLYWEEIWDESSSPSSSAAVADGSDFHIHVLYGSARRTVWVKGMDTVQTLKHKVRRFMEWDWQCKFGDISLFKYPFRVGINELVDNEKTMDEYGIKEGDTIESLSAETLG
ncbi:hypothetical protein niasHT_010621 [Heterodera trifolii]|uniref:Ubiquitin-like domain-containing protein n=1 Tax=Heterodera trifolii TaxID=157864 RepID=A0ABD2L9C9_9BILA